MNLWQLRVFLVVSETGSFSAAATTLHMTQPGVSQQIRSLETYLGTQLFVRRGHGVELTAAGTDLLDPARRLLNLSELTERTLMSRRGEVSGRIRVGCALPSGGYIFHNWLADFRSRFPDVAVHLEQSEPGPLLSGLRAQELDAGLVLGRMRGRGLMHHRIMEDPLTWIVPLNHQWSWSALLSQTGEHVQFTSAAEARKAGETDDGQADDEGGPPAVKLLMLKEEPLVLEHGVGESHADARRALNDTLEERGLTVRDLRVVLELPSPMCVACAVAEGIGVGLVPRSIANRLVGQVVPVRVEGFSLAQHVYLVRDRKALHSPAVNAWWKFVESKVTKDAEIGEQGGAASPETTSQPTRKDPPRSSKFVKLNTSPSIQKVEVPVERS